MTAQHAEAARPLVDASGAAAAADGAGTPASTGARASVIVKGVVLGVMLAAVLLFALGWRPVVLRSQAMAPTIRADAVLLAHPIDPADVRINDVITVPGVGAPSLTRRVVAIEQRDGQLVAQLQADANTSPDPDGVVLGEGLLRAVLSVPLVGLLATTGAGALAALLMLAALALALWAVRRRRANVVSAASAPVARSDRASPAAEPPAPVVIRTPAPASAAIEPPAPASAATESPAPAAAATESAANESPATESPVIDTAADDELDPLLVDLGETLRSLAADEMPTDVVRAIARSHAGVLLGLASVEGSRAAQPLDDGARFVLMSLVDADIDALAGVSASSERMRAATRAVADWWRSVAQEVPTAVWAELGSLLRDPD